MIHERILAAAARLAEVICFHQQQRLSSRRQQEGRQGQCLILPSNHSIYILLRPVISCSRALRSSGKYISHFVQSELFCHSNSRWFVLLSFPNKGGKRKNMDLTRCCFWKMLIDKLFVLFVPKTNFLVPVSWFFYFNFKSKILNTVDVYIFLNIHSHLTFVSFQLSTFVNISTVIVLKYTSDFTCCLNQNISRWYLKFCSLKKSTLTNVPFYLSLVGQIKLCKHWRVNITLFLSCWVIPLLLTCRQL